MLIPNITGFPTGNQMERKEKCIMNEVMLKDVDVLDEVDEEKEGGLTVSDNFGIMLKHYRKIKNLSLKELENLCGVSASYINRLERGKGDRRVFPLF